MKHFISPTNPMRVQFDAKAHYQARHFSWAFADGVGTVTLNRPERKNPLTFDSYAELRDLFHALRFATDVKVVVVTGAGGNFCSGGDVHEIIGPLTRMSMPELLEFTRMTGDLVKAMRNCPQPVVGAIDRELSVTAVWAVDLNHISGKAGRRVPNGKGAVSHH